MIRLAGLSRAIRDAYHAKWCGPKCKPPCEGTIEPDTLAAVRKAVGDFIRAAFVPARTLEAAQREERHGEQRLAIKEALRSRAFAAICLSCGRGAFILEGYNSDCNGRHVMIECRGCGASIGDSLDPLTELWTVEDVIFASGRLKESQ